MVNQETYLRKQSKETAGEAMFSEQSQNLINQLQSENWEPIDPQQLSLVQWIECAKEIRKERSNTNEKRTMFVARIQCILVKAGLISDADFVRFIQVEDN